MDKRSLILMVLLTGLSSVFAQNKEVLTGKWLTASGDAQIRIYQSSGKFSGRIIWLKKPNDQLGKPRIDERNPDQALSKRPLIGTEILKGFTYSDDGIWEGGTIYDPKTGRIYNCKISLSSQDKINVRGFVGVSLLGRTETWSRVR